MKSLWILAAAAQEGGEGAEISSVSTEGAEITEEFTAVDGSNDTGTKDVQGSEPLIPFWLLIVLMVFMIFMIMRGPKKKQQQQQKMVQSLKKNDKVRTAGGILGTVIDVKDDEITLKVDESNNTKIRVLKGAIANVLSDEKGQ